VAIHLPVRDCLRLNAAAKSFGSFLEAPRARAHVSAYIKESGLTDRWRKWVERGMQAVDSATARKSSISSSLVCARSTLPVRKSSGSSQLTFLRWESMRRERERLSRLWARRREQAYETLGCCWRTAVPLPFFTALVVHLLRVAFAGASAQVAFVLSGSVVCVLFFSQPPEEEERENAPWYSDCDLVLASVASIVMWQLDRRMLEAEIVPYVNPQGQHPHPLRKEYDVCVVSFLAILIALRCDWMQEIVGLVCIMMIFLFILYFLIWPLFHAHAMFTGFMLVCICSVICIPDCDD